MYRQQLYTLLCYVRVHVFVPLCVCVRARTRVYMRVCVFMCMCDRGPAAQREEES